VIWSEGLLLGPQHLQQQDRYHEERGAELFRAARPFAHGFTQLELDEEAIVNGRVHVHRAAGVLPGGTPFSIPDRDLPPVGRAVEERFPVNEPEIPVYLGLRVHRPGQAEVAEIAEGALSEARYGATAARLPDESTGADEREIRVARANLRLLFADESPGDYEALPLARIVRRPEGGFAYKADYVPPCLALAASPYLQRLLRKLLEIMVTRADGLSARRRFTGKGVAEFGRDDTVAFWFLGAVNGHIPVLGHRLRSAHEHPEAVYADLAGLAGQLTTLSDMQVRDIPAYDHDNATAAFTDLAQRITKLLDFVIPTNYVRIPLTRRDDLVHVGRVQEDRLLEPAMPWFLGVYANVAAVELQSTFPEVAKISAPDKVDFLVAHALKGLGLRLAQTLPPSVPAQAGHVYFQLEKTGDIWEGIAGSRSLAIYAPPEFPGIVLELVAVRE